MMFLLKVAYITSMTSGSIQKPHLIASHHAKRYFPYNGSKDLRETSLLTLPAQAEECK